jgi:hypothetical protein
MPEAAKKVPRYLYLGVAVANWMMKPITLFRISWEREGSSKGMTKCGCVCTGYRQSTCRRIQDSGR